MTENRRSANWRRVPAPSADASAPLRFARDPLRVTLFLLTVVTISRVHEAIGLGALHPAFLLFAFAAGYAMITPGVLIRESLFRYWPARILVALLAFACVSAPFGLSLGASGSFILTDYVKVIVYALLLMLVIRGAADLSMYVWAYVISCGILVWMAVFLFQLSATGTGTSRLDGLYTYDSNDLGCVLMVGLPLTVLTFQTSGRRGKVASGLILAGMGWAIARSGSRGALLGLVVVLLAILVMLKEVPVPKRVGFVAVVSIVLALTAPAGYWEQMETILKPKQDYNWTEQQGRKQLWERGLHYMWTHPLFGVGINNFGRAEATISKLAQEHVPGGPGIKWAAPHNSFIQVASELGIPGLILWSSLVFGGIVSCIRLRRRLPSGWARGDPGQQFIYRTTVYLPISFLGFAATGFFVSFAYIDPVYVLAALVVGVHRSAYVKMREMNAPVGSPVIPLRRSAYQPPSRRIARR